MELSKKIGSRGMIVHKRKGGIIERIIKGFIIGASMLVPGASGGTMAIILGIYDELIHAVSDSNLTQFNLQDGNLNISMSAEKTIVQQVAANADAVAFAAQYQTAVQPVLQSVPQSAVQNNAGAGASSSEEPLTGNIVKSPLVGTYYAASSPDSAPFVKVGDKVTKGQVLGIVEAMKLMNEIESEFDGTVKEILVENEQMVEFGQPMFVIE